MQDVVMYAGSRGALLGAVEVCDQSVFHPAYQPATLPCMNCVGSPSSESPCYATFLEPFRMSVVRFVRAMVFEGYACVPD